MKKINKFRSRKAEAKGKKQAKDLPVVLSSLYYFATRKKN
jgi:hypothetical protein